MRKTIVTTLLEREKADPSVSVDTISNDNTEEFLAQQEQEAGEKAVLGFAEKALDPVHVTKVHNVDQITPMTIMTSKSPNGDRIAALVFLCKDTYSDFTFTLAHNYIIENDEQRKQVEKNPIHDNVNYISKRLAANMIMNTLPGYITDFNFYYNKEADNPNEAFYMFAVPNREENRQIIQLNMSAEIFSVFAFIDDYIVSDSHNIHDLQIATVAGYKKSNTLVTVNFVDNIDSIVSLAPAAEKDSTDVAVVFKTLEFVDASTKNVYKILTAFNFGKKYPKKKFRGATISTLEEEYGKDVDQYVSNYMIECRIKNLDKDYLIIKAKNKDSICKLFFIDNDNQRKIEELIEMY